MLAAPTDEEKAIARTLFEQGRSLAKAGQWAEACPKLAESQRLDPGMGTLYNLADCHEHVGKLAAAWVEFSEVLDQAKRAGQGEREKIARERVNALNGRITRVTLRRKEPLAAGGDVILDGKPVGSAVIDVPLPIDPGEHKVAVVENGQKTPDRSFTVPAGSAQGLEVELPLAPPPPPPPAPAPPAEPPPPPPPLATPVGTWHRPVATVGLGMGLAALGASVVLGFVAKGQWSDVEKQCPDRRCTTPKAYEGWEQAQGTATLGTVTFISGAVIVAAATVLWLVAPSPSSRAAAR